MTTPTTAGLEAMIEGFVNRLECLDAVMLFALLKAAPEQPLHGLAATVIAVAEAETLGCCQQDKKEGR